MAFEPNAPATQQQVRALTELLESVEQKLDLIFHAQAEVLVREQRQREPEEELQIPLDEANARVNAVNMKKGEIQQDFDLAEQWLSAARRQG